MGFAINILLVAVTLIMLKPSGERAQMVAQPFHTNRIAKSATCNGDGNGQIGGNSPESFRLWQHLADAGLIEGSYSGVTGPNTAGDHDPGINSMKLRMGGPTTGLSVYYSGSIPASYATVYMFGGEYGNGLTVGSYWQLGLYDAHVHTRTGMEH